MFRRLPTARNLTLALAAALLAATIGTGLAQSTHEVQMVIAEVEGRPFPEFYFEPTGLAIEPGDTVRFVAASPHHTVTAYHARQGKPMRVPEGVGPFSSPVVPVGDSWSYTFETPGVYDLWCAPHELFGMVMRVVVGEASGPGTAPIETLGPMGVEHAAAAVLNADRMRPDAILSAQAVSWQSLPDSAKILPPILQGIEPPEE